jgi:hypothetical protein
MNTVVSIGETGFPILDILDLVSAHDLPPNVSLTDALRLRPQTGPVAILGHLGHLPAD